MSNDLSPSGSRWEPFSSPRPVLAHPDDRPDDRPEGVITDDRAEARAPHPVYDITSTPTHAVAGPPGRKGVRRAVVLVAAAAGLVLAGGAGGYAIGHATGGTTAAGIDGGAGGFGGDRHRVGGKAPGDGQGGLGVPDGGALPQGGTGTGGTGTGTDTGGTGSGAGTGTATTTATSGLSA